MPSAEVRFGRIGDPGQSAASRVLSSAEGKRVREMRTQVARFKKAD
jgi:hypothetical protein